MKRYSIFVLLFMMSLSVLPVEGTATEQPEISTSGPFETVTDLQISQNNWGYSFRKNGKNYTFVNGTVSDPIGFGLALSLPSGVLSIADQNWAYPFEKNGQYYIQSKNGTSQVYDTYPEVRVSNNRMLVQYLKNGQQYLSLDNQEYGPYQVLPGSLAVSDTNWAVAYFQEGKSYVLMNGKSYGPYLSVANLAVSNQHWGFFYRDTQSSQIMIMLDGNSYPGYLYTGQFKISGERWILATYDNPPGGKYSVLTDKEHYGSFNDELADISVSPLRSGYVDRSCNVVIDQKTVWNTDTFCLPDSLAISDSNWLFTYATDYPGSSSAITAKNIYTVINGQQYGPFEAVGIPQARGNSWAFPYKENGMWYIKSSGLQNASATPSFRDISQDSRYFDAVNFLREREIITGYSDGTFGPEKKINRAEFTKIIIGIITKNPKGENCFHDVTREWFAPYICYAKTIGIVRGYPDGLFHPEREVNLAEALKIVFGTLSIELVAANDSPWYEKYIQTGMTKALLNGVVIDAAHNITRGELALLLYSIHRQDLPPMHF